jgi:hypothetical protein
MRTGFEGPIERVVSDVHEAIALARALADNDRLPQNVTDDATKIMLTLKDVPTDMDALSSYMTAQDRHLNDMADESIRMAQEVTTLMEENAQLTAKQTAERYVERDVSAAPTKDDATAA